MKSLIAKDVQSLFVSSKLFGGAYGRICSLEFSTLKMFTPKHI